MKKTPKELSMFFSLPPNKIRCKQHCVFNSNIKILKFSRTMMLNTKHWCTFINSILTPTPTFSTKNKNNKIFAYVYKCKNNNETAQYCKKFTEKVVFFLVENVGVDVGVDVRVE